MNLDLTEKWAKEIALMSDAEFEENCKHIATLLKRRKQALRIHDVVGRSEQLKAFLLYLQESQKQGETIVDNDKFIDGYLKSL